MEFWTGAGGGGKNRMMPGAIANGYETAAESAATAE